MVQSLNNTWKHLLSLEPLSIKQTFEKAHRFCHSAIFSVDSCTLRPFRLLLLHPQPICQAHDFWETQKSNCQSNSPLDNIHDTCVLGLELFQLLKISSTATDSNQTSSSIVELSLRCLCCITCFFITFGSFAKSSSVKPVCSRQRLEVLIFESLKIVWSVWLTRENGRRMKYKWDCKSEMADVADLVTVTPFLEERKGMRDTSPCFSNLGASLL